MNNARNMKKYLFLLVVLLSALPLSATAVGAEKIRIIMDTDARAEVDDQHAIAYMLFSGNHFEVEGITVNRGSDGPHRTDRRQTIDDHFKEAVDVVRLCDSWGKFPVIKGQAGNYRQIRSNINNATFDGSDAVNFIIERAHAPSDRLLIIFSIGNLTIPALALLKDPTIAPKIEIWWLGTQWPANRGENNQVGDIDATDALLADPNNVTFKIIPYQTFRPPGAAGVTFAEMIEHFTGRGPQVSPAVNTRLGSFTCFGDFSVELFNRGVESRQKANGRTLLDMVAATALKNNVGQYSPYEMGAPSFVYEKESATGSESPGWPGRWVENSSNPRRVTIWRYPDRDAVWNDIFHTMDNYVLPRQQPVDSDGVQEPMKIILDTDIDGDIDDVGALAVLHAMADNGEIEILAVMVSSLHEWSAPAVDVINTHYNRPDIPIGVPKGAGQNKGSRYAKQLAEEFPHDLKSNSAAPNAVTLYRQMFSQQPDNSVVISTIGYLTNLHDLLNSKADQYSSLNGKDLVKRKVKHYVCMASGMGNFRPHAEAAVNVVNNWPTLSTFTAGGDFAWSIRTGSVLSKTPQNNPVRRGYEHYSDGTARDRHSANQLSLFCCSAGSKSVFQTGNAGLSRCRRRHK